MDHCYYIGEYRSAAHSICNLKYRVPITVLIVIYIVYLTVLTTTTI